LLTKNMYIGESLRALYNIVTSGLLKCSQMSF
jgi:hypothetical protein